MGCAPSWLYFVHNTWGCWIWFLTAVSFTAALEPCARTITYHPRQAQIFSSGAIPLFSNCHVSPIPLNATRFLPTTWD